MPEIQCPLGQMNVLVAGQGSGSGSGTICVRGIVGDGGNDEAVPTYVRVRVVSGNVPPPPQSPDDGGVDAPVVGGKWCAQNVPVPGTGVPLTALAWAQVGGSGGSGSWGPLQWVWFTAVVSDGVDCCADCSCASEQGSPAEAFQAWPPPPPPFPPTLTDQPS